MRTILLSFLAVGTLLFGDSAGAEEAIKDAPVTVTVAAEKIGAGIQLLDVRTPEEWAEGHLKGASLLPITGADFAGKAKALLDPKKPVLVYCHSGTRSANAAKQLRAAGFTVHDLAGGIVAWEQAGKPVVK